MSPPHLPTSPHISPYLPISPHISPHLPIPPRIFPHLARRHYVDVDDRYRRPNAAAERGALPVGRRGQPRSAEISEAIRDLPVTGALLQGLVCRVKDNGESLRLLCWRRDLAEIEPGLDAVRCCPSLHPRDRREIAQRSPRDTERSPHFGRTSAAPRPHLGRTSAAPRPHLGRTSAAPRPHLGCTSAALRPHLHQVPPEALPRMGDRGGGVAQGRASRVEVEGDATG